MGKEMKKLRNDRKMGNGWELDKRLLMALPLEVQV